MKTDRRYVTHVKTIYQADMGSTAADAVEDALKVAIESGQFTTVLHSGTEYTIDPMEILARILNPPKPKLPEHVTVSLNRVQQRPTQPAEGVSLPDGVRFTANGSYELEPQPTAIHKPLQ